MTKCRRNISSYINDNKINASIQYHGKKHLQYNVNANLNSQTKSKRHVISKYFSRPNLRLIITTSVICLLFSLSNHFSPVNGKLTRKTYTVWDLTPQELNNLLEQEKALQKRKRAVDIFFRRRAKKTKEFLPLNEYENNNAATSKVSNNIGRYILIITFGYVAFLFPRNFYPKFYLSLSYQVRISSLVKA